MAKRKAGKAGLDQDGPAIQHSPEDSDASILGDQGALLVYQNHLSANAVAFIFSEAFSDALHTTADKASVSFGVSAEAAIEEFRRFLAIKVFAMDTDATKISPTPIMDFLWHAAILDTRFYSTLQASLDMVVHHDPSVANEEQTLQREKCLITMKALYKVFFETAPLSFSSRERQQPRMQVLCKIMNGPDYGKCVKTLVHPTDSIDHMKSIIQEKEGIPMDKQYFLHAGARLECGRMLADYKIRANTVIRLIVGASGGN